jgi:glycosyltransferase involved in cell wall biosynthesis
MDAATQLDRRPFARSDLATLGGLRVALVHDWLTGMRGGEKCLEVLCQAFPNATLHTLIHKRGALSEPIESMAIRTTPLQNVPGIFRHYRHVLPLMPLAARTWRTGPVDLVISLSHCVAKAIRVPHAVPHVCYCFTPMRYAWHGRTAYLEKWAARRVKQTLASTILDAMRAWDRKTAAGVTHFVAISETVRDRIATCYGRPSRVIRPPVDTDFYQPADVARTGPYLCVSALVPYKQIEHAVIACSRSERPLVVIGAGPERPRLERLAGSTVRFLGWQPDSVLREHYQRCRALLFPGDEDFGIVPVEALACGAPVIALRRGGVAETVNDDVGRTYTESSPYGLLCALAEWEADGRPHDAIRARQRAEALSVPRFRDEILQFLAGVLPRH